MIVQPKGNDLNGALSYLFYTSNENYENFVEIKASGIVWGNVLTLINYDINGTDQFDNCATTDKENSSYTIFLKNNALALTHYTLKSRTWNDYNCPRSFLMEASNDNKEYRTLHSITNSDYLCGLSKIKTFKTRRIEAFRYFRIRQTGLTLSNNNNLVLHKIELFGNLCPLNKKCNFPQLNTCNTNRRSFVSIPLLIYLLIVFRKY